MYYGNNIRLNRGILANTLLGPYAGRGEGLPEVRSTPTTIIVVLF